MYIYIMQNFHWYVATFQQHLHMEYISLSWYDIPELVVPIKISYKEATEPRLPLDLFEAITSNVLRSPPWHVREMYTSSTPRVNLVTNPVISHEWGNNMEVLTTSGTYPWPFVTQILWFLSRFPTRKLLNQGFPLINLKSSLRTF
jgi:hypothetical protein